MTDDKPTREEVQQLFDQMRRPVYAQANPGSPSVEVGREPVDPYEFACEVLRKWR